MLSHTRIFRVGGDRDGSRERDCIIEGMQVACRWHAFVAPKSTQYGDEIREGYREHRVYTPYSIVELDQIRILIAV